MVQFQTVQTTAFTDYVISNEVQNNFGIYYIYSLGIMILINLVFVFKEIF